MFGKVEAMKKIADATDRQGLSVYPRYMQENMQIWEREGLIDLGRTDDGVTFAKITEAGRKIAKKAMR